MRTLAIVNQKGGSGKTSACVNLAAALGERRKRVLVVDLDPQACASSWLGVGDGGEGLLEVFTNNGNLADLVIETDVSGVELIPSSTWMVGAERAMAQEPGSEGILRQGLEELPGKSWDYCFLDCPPSLGLLAVSALMAAPQVLVPVTADTMALGGLASLLQSMDRVRERLNPGLELSGVLACRVDSRTRLSREVVERLRKRFGKLVFRTVIRESVRHREAWSFSKPITLYAPRSPGAEDFRALAAEFLRRTKRGRT